MTHIKKFSYQDTSKRWLIPLTVFLTFFTLTVIISDTILTLKQYLLYNPITAIVLFISILSFFIGNLSGKFFYTLLKKSIIVNIIFSFLYGSVIAVYFLKNIFPGNAYSHLNLYLNFRYFSALLLILPSFFAGVLNCYFLNISTGDFLDEKNLLKSYLSAFFLSISAGLFFNSRYIFTGINYNKITPFFALFSILIVVIIIFINKSYSPEPLFARHYLDDDAKEPAEQVQRDDLFYTYMNFTYIITYIFLGHLLLIKFFGNIYYHGQIYISIMFLSVIIGYLCGRLKKPSFWYVYSEMLFPLLFLSNLFMLYYFGDRISIRIGYIIASIPALVYGFSLRQTFENIILKYDHDKRFNIINFSMFILPVPVLVSISLIQYTNLLFYILLYLLTIMNIIIPGIFLYNLKISPVKKISYFIFTLIFIPAVIVLHLYFKISLDNKPFFSRSDNFELLQNTNFNLPYITEKGEIRIYNSPVFYISDSNIRNLKRAAAAASLFAGNESKTLIIDSNQKFFSNPVFSVFPGMLCIDTVASKHVDYNSLPLSGRQFYAPVEKDLINFLITETGVYDTILDSPNLLDQKINKFRFSGEYYKQIRKKLSDQGVYSVIIDLKYIDNGIINNALDQLRQNFKFHAIFLFSDIVLITASNSQDSLKIDKSSTERIKKILSDETNFGEFFYSEIQPLNNILFTEIESFKNMLLESRTITGNGFYEIPQKLIDYYISYDPDWFKSLVKDNDERFYSDIKSSIRRDSKVLSLLKKLEYAESTNQYDKEIEYLFELKKYASYNDSIKKYVNNQLSNKERYYQSEAQHLEKLRKWDDAAKLYTAILSINDKNFEANYRLGLLYLTLQNLEKAFDYLDKALKLQKDNPQAMYQMGTLMFFNDKFKEAIHYLEEANKLNVSNASLYMYLGISYEKTGDNEKAKQNYEKAIQEDPNDSKLKSLLESLNMKMNTLPAGEQESSKTNMIDDEQGENITIPVNKKAINARLKDSE